MAHEPTIEEQIILKLESLRDELAKTEALLDALIEFKLNNNI